MSSKSDWSAKAYRRLADSQLGDQLRPVVRSARRRRSRPSNFNEDAIIGRLTSSTDIVPFCVDIGASDGVTMSNTLALFRRGWFGFSAEMSGPRFRSLAREHSRFPNSVLFRGRVTPDVVVELLRAAETPRDFGLLSLDIDGYDYFVLEKILTQFRPTIVCAEINEKIPPPLCFTVNYSREFRTDGGHFYGQSISQVELLCERFGYGFIELDYNNVFLMPAESPHASISAAQAYKSGYQDRLDRFERLPWNADMEPLLQMGPEDGIDFLRSKFAGYEGQYTLTLGQRGSSHFH